MEHQDWKTLVIGKKVNAKPTETVQKQFAPQNAATITSSQKPAWKIEQQVDAETGKPLTLVSSDVAKLIIAARTAQKLTQAQLANKLNVPEKEIKEIESGKAVQNKQLISRIKKVLNVK